MFCKLCAGQNVRIHAWEFILHATTLSVVCHTDQPPGDNIGPRAFELSDDEHSAEQHAPTAATVFSSLRWDNNVVLSFRYIVDLLQNFIK